ncbi:hypothetical protein BpHYR1_044097 [Brachionus plicatilis]|uniref:Uncharacterized protein n=1 Tax=Brachionus plicatilis TaxID=10195 RepID=A0A3M7RNE9_BRAPC|nr:hypothetical protein BpHYR1_044097 [Brachionus plicatilis]
MLNYKQICLIHYSNFSELKRSNRNELHNPIDELCLKKIKFKNSELNRYCFEIFSHNFEYCGEI